MEAIDALTRAAASHQLQTASAYRVLIVMAPQLDVAEYREVKVVSLQRATRMHKSRVIYALQQLLAASVIERKVDIGGVPAQYRWGAAIRG